MSEWNKKGEECDCGSTTEHERSPGCTPPGDTEGRRVAARLPDAERRISALESAVRRIETRVTGGRPTPPGVFPPIGGALVPFEGQCAYPIGGGVVCLLPPGHDGAHGMTWASPAEAAIFERGGYLPGCACERHTSPSPAQGMTDSSRSADEQRREWARRAAGLSASMEYSRRRIYEATARIEDAPRPTAPIVGLDVVLPPISELVTPKVKALTEKWGPQFVGDGALAKALEKHGAELEAACNAPTPAAMLGEAVELLGRVGDMVRNAGDLDRHIIATIDELRTYIEEAKAKRDAEARLVNGPRGRKCENGIATVGFKHHCERCGLWEDIGDTEEEARMWVAEKHARDDAPGLVNCPRVIHDGPCSDVRDCAAISKTDAQGWTTCPTHGRRMTLGEQCAACAEVPR